MEQVKQIAYTVLRVFFGTLLALIVAAGVGVMDYTWADWKPLLYAAMASAAVVIINALNPKDARYGLGVSSE